MKTVNTLLSFHAIHSLAIFLVLMGIMGVFTSSVQAQDFVDVTSSIFPASPNNPIPQTGGDLVWGDFDADGDMDFVMTGTNGSISDPYQTLIFRYNSSTSRFERFLGAATLPKVRNSRPAWGDYDSDGDLDLIIVGQNNQGTRFAKIFNFNGFNFQEDLSLTSVLQASAVSDGAASFADYNNDGQLDLLIAGNNGNTSLQLYKHDNLPSNNYLADISLPGVTKPYINWGDYDADGDLDLAYCGTDLANQPSTKIYINQGNGNLIPLSTSIPNVKDGSVEWGDYDNDGDLDILVAGESTGGFRITEIFKNNGIAGFARVSAGLIGISEGEAVWVDYNHDGWLDISLTGRDGNSPFNRTTVLYENDGLGNFNLDVPRSNILQNLNGGSRISWADYNQDGKLDVMCSGTLLPALPTASYSFRFYRNDINLSNTQPAAPSNPQSFQSGASVILSWQPPANLGSIRKRNGLTYNLHIGTVPNDDNIRPAQSDLTSGYHRLSTFGALKDTIWAISSANLNNGTTYYWRVQAIDQDFEASPWSAQGSFTYVNPFTFTSLFADSTGSKFDVTPPGLDNASIDLGDIDRDGDLDLVYAGADASNVPQIFVYFFNSANQEYVKADAVGLPGIRRGDLTLGDVDGDGYLDLAMSGLNTGGSGSRIFRVYRFNPVTREFGSFVNFAGLSDGSLDFGDYDNDGDLDLLSTGFNGGTQTRIYFNQSTPGNISFPNSNQFGLPNIDRGDARFGDFDNDGYPDIALMGKNNSGTSVTAIYHNDGGTGFTQLNPLANLTPVSGGEIAWSDLNNDGFLDIVASGFDVNNNPETYIRLNNQGVDFTNSSIYNGTQFRSGSLDLGDINNDGYNDLVISGEELTGSNPSTAPATEIYIHNQSPLNPTLNIDNSSSSIVTDVRTNSAMKLGDYNGDNKLDIFLLGKTGTGPTNNVFKLFQNVGNQSNTTPTAPTNVRHEIDGFDVKISWNPPSGYSPFEEKSLSYSVLVYEEDAPNTIQKYIHSIVDSSLSDYGYNRKALRGNVEHAREFTFKNVQPGKYKYAIQTIDQDYEGSAFSQLQCFEFEFPTFVDQTTNFATGFFPQLKNASIAMGDYRGPALSRNTPDGYLDLILSGETVSGTARTFTYFFEPGAGKYIRDTEADSNLIQVQQGHMVWGDVNNDTTLDLLIMGQGQSFPRTRLYYNLSGTFNDANPNTDFRDFPGLSNGFCSLIDFNNDGFRDVFLSGENSFGNAVCSLYVNNGKNIASQSQFIRITPDNLLAFESSSGDWGDFNNDGYLDLLISGETSLGNKTFVYPNDGFSNFLPGIELVGVSNGSAKWGDYNSDGFLDVVVSGNNGSNAITYVYENNLGNSFTLIQSNIQGFQEGNSSWGDYNLDGYKDLLLSGGLSDISTDREVSLYRYDAGLQQFVEDQVAAAPLQAVNKGSASEWADIDLDGKLDILLAGQRSSGPDSNTFKIYRNVGIGSSTTPTAPGLGDVQINGYEAVLSWSAPTNIADSLKPGLSYNVVLGRVSGGAEQRSPMSLRANGRRKVVARGMANGETSFRFYNLSNGTYYWRVQAIDADYQGGPFSAEGSFEYKAPILLDSTDFIFSSPPTGYSRGQLAWGDYDNDADLDLLVSGNRNSSESTQLFVNENGILTAGPTFRGFTQSKLEWGDYDHDQDLDFIISGIIAGGNAATFIYKNDGAGNFTEITTHGIDSLSGGDVAWIDFDNDGDLDVIKSGEGSQSLEADLYQNIGGDRFVAIQAGFQAFRDGDISVVDYNLDGFKDILFTGDVSTTASPQALTQLYRNTGLGSFVLVNSNLPPYRNSSSDWADINGDRYPDLLIMGLSSNGIPRTQVFANNNGVFTDLGISSALGVYNGMARFGDFDDDDLVDFAYVGAENNFRRSAYLFKNEGSGNFSYQAVPSIALDTVENAAIAWGDVDGDNKLDLALMGSSIRLPFTQQLKVYRNVDSTLNLIPSIPTNLNASISADTLILRWNSPPPQVNHTYNLYVGSSTAFGDSLSPSSDINSGFRKLAAAGNAGYRKEFKLAGINSGSFFWSVQSVGPDFEGSAFAPEQSINFVRPRFINTNKASLKAGVPNNFLSGQLNWGDLDRDGDLDLIINGTDRTGASVLVRLRNDGGPLELVSGLSALGNSASALGDYDNDGDLELILSGNNAGNLEISLYENNGLGSLQKTSLQGEVTPIQNGNLSLVDYDNDGDLDLFVAGASANGNISKLYRNTQGNFEEDTYVQIDAISNPQAKWADFDQDGDKDLALIGESGGNPFIRIYRNNGIRNGFTALEAAQNPFPQLSEASIDWGDLDNDGYLDLLLSGAGPSNPQTEVFIYRPVSGNFEQGPILRGVRNGTGLWGDINDDGFQDILLSGLGNNGSPQAYLYLNNQDNTFEWDSVTSLSIRGLNEAKLAWADIDLDGKMDVATLGKISISEGFLGIYSNIDSALNQQSLSPTNLAYDQSADSVVLSWDDNLNPSGTHYNLQVGSHPDSLNLLGPMSLPDGFRQVMGRGNAGSRKKFRLEGLPAGTYFWKVQAVEQDFEGSPFSALDSFEYRPPNFIDYNLVLFDEAPAAFDKATTAWLDYNNDGFLDLLVVGLDEMGNRTASIYQNDFGERFVLDQENSNRLTGLEDVQIATADFDNNGHVDILLAGNGGSQASLELYFNFGGSFSQGTPGLIALRNPRMDVGDLNNDGAPDIVITGISGAQSDTEVYLNNGSGIFNTQSFLLVDVKEGDVLIRDFDKNGLQDIFLTGENQNGQFVGNLYLNDPVQGLQWVSNALPPEVVFVSNTRVEAGDLNKDGLPDLLLTASQGGNPAVFCLENLGENGSGQFFDLLNVGLDSIPALVDGSYHWGDYNDDQLIDLAIFGRAANGASVSKTFASQAGMLPFREDSLAGPFLAQMSNGAYQEWGDFDNDGKLDFVLSGQDSSGQATFSLYKNVEPTPSSAPVPPSNLNIVAVGSNLRLEWTAVDSAYSYNVYLAIEGDTSFTVSPLSDTLSGRRKIVGLGNSLYLNKLTIIGLEQKRDYVWGVQSVDPGYEASPFVKSEFSFTPPAFEDQTAIRFDNFPEAVEVDGDLIVLDYNLDGRLDIAASSQTDGNQFIRFYLNQGNNFVLDEQNSSSIPAIEQGCLKWNDFDNDNDPDIFITGQSSPGNQLIGIYRNDEGVFTYDSVASASLVPVAQSSAGWGDFDLDGDHDLYVMGIRDNGDHFSALYVNQEDGSFKIKQDTGIALEALTNGAVSWGDYDKTETLSTEDKGYDDLAVVGTRVNGQGIALVYHNNGDGTFSLESSASIPPITRGDIVFADLDNNRFLDLVVTGTSGNTPISRVYQNDPGIGFTEVNLPSALPGTIDGRVIVGDYDDDGFGDLLLVGKEDQTGKREISLYKNRQNFNFVQDILTTNDLDSLKISHPAWGDVDNDGKLDLIVGSMVSFGNTEAGMGVLRNIDQSPNQTPVAPTGLEHSIFGESVSLSWQDILDDSLGIRGEYSFNLRLGTLDSMTNRWSPLSDLQTDKPYVVSQGNVGQNTVLEIKNLPSGTYSWCVQSIGQDYESSPCSRKDTFSFARPVPQIISDNIATWYPDSSAQVISAITVLSDTNISEVKVWFKGIADSVWVSEPAEKNGRVYSFDVTLGKVDELGVAYYFELIGRFGFDILSDTFYTWREYVGGIDYENLRFGRNVSNYNLLSFPLDLEDNEIQNFLETPEALGRQNSYRWRFWNWSTIDSAFREYGNSLNNVEPGQGYFLITARDRSFNSGRGRVVQASDENPFVWELSEGWNLVGNPYFYNLSWQDILRANPEASQRISNDFLVYRTSYQAANGLNRLEGGWIYANEPTQLAIPVRKNPNLNRLSEIQSRMTGSLSSPYWMLPITAEQGELKNLITGLGMNPAASLGWDPMDGVLPIRMGDYIETQFEKNTPEMPLLSRDIVPSSESFEWELTIRSDGREKELKLSWPQIQSGGGEKALYLFDLDNQEIFEMRSRTFYYSAAEEKERHFRIIYGRRAEVMDKLQPEKVHLGLIYPNPAVGPVIIPFSLPPTSLPYQTRIEILSLNGKLVRKVFEGELKGGFHSIKWDLKGDKDKRLSRGTYIYRLSIKDENGWKVQSRRLLIGAN